MTYARHQEWPTRSTALVPACLLWFLADGALVPTRSLVLVFVVVVVVAVVLDVVGFCSSDVTTNEAPFDALFPLS